MFSKALFDSRFFLPDDNYLKWKGLHSIDHALKYWVKYAFLNIFFFAVRKLIVIFFNGISCMYYRAYIIGRCNLIYLLILSILISNIKLAEASRHFNVYRFREMFRCSIHRYSIFFKLISRTKQENNTFSPLCIWTDFLSKLMNWWKHLLWKMCGLWNITWVTEIICKKKFNYFKESQPHYI